jgi:rhomboid protease GluP
MGSYPPVPPLQAHRSVSGDPRLQPEILPPDASYIPPSQPVRRRRPAWAAEPATYLLVGISCAVYLAMVGHGISITSPTVGQLMNWGANNAGAVLLGGQWWRIVTAMFLHVGILHLSVNMWCLWNLGLLAEPLMGSVGLIAVYLLTGAAGNLLSTLVSWIWPIHYGGSILFPASAGASGAIFGIAGALIVLLKSNRLPVPPQEVKRLRKSVIYFAAINLVLGLGISVGTDVIGSGIHIDNMAHLGGFTCGLLFAAPMLPRIGSPRDAFKTRLQIAIISVTALLVLFGFYLAHLPPQS